MIRPVRDFLLVHAWTGGWMCTLTEGSMNEPVSDGFAAL